MIDLRAIAMGVVVAVAPGLLGLGLITWGVLGGPRGAAFVGFALFGWTLGRLR